MIDGNVNLEFLTDEMLSDIDFTHTISDDYYRNPLWDQLGVSMPNYPKESLELKQVYDEQGPSWVFHIKDQFDSWVLHSTVTLSMLAPGKITPPHKDEMYRLQNSAKCSNIDTSKLEPVRVNILLQDKKIGHFFDMGRLALSNYSKGDYIIIRPGAMHSCGNIGYENRYTMQISGFIAKEN